MVFDFESYIRTHFTYKNGELIRDDRKGSSGSIDKDGYLIIKIKGKQFKAHRIVWFLCKGKFPDGVIDHINRVRTDNRIENLRDVSQAENVKNTVKKPNADTGYIGIYLDKCTVGLKARYCTRVNNKIFRFRRLDDAVRFKKENISGNIQSFTSDTNRIKSSKRAV